MRKELGEAIRSLQRGLNLGMPLSRPMPTVGVGASELRVRDRSGIYRSFYYTKSRRGVLIFHAFVKKNQKTTKRDIELGKLRLREMLYEEKE
ncbi:MAG: type II toxin-antitoxin system RelE/ParE family toxin [Deltaproteobacteria bacterium]|nr:type II toxin-antitoxin system RelE/ParE family toxin [Deltaproteobacteria bacterium]